jgi:opacity protein-like surface antigen
MKHLVIMTFVAVLVGVGTVHAQTPGAPSSPGIGYAEVTFGPTFGHKASGSVGGEAGYFFGSVGIFGEAGRMGDIATTQIESKAQIIAGAINGTFQAKQPANYFDAGVVWRFQTMHHVTPYALFGVGSAKVSNRVTFAVAGSDVTSQLNQFGVQVGGDLAGSYTKVFVTAGAGVHATFRDRWISDVSYRFGRVGQDTVSGEVIYKPISTNRLQFGAGIKF